MKTCLLVYYSRTGTTRKIADAMAQAYDCDVEAIREPRSRAGPFGYARSIYDAIRKRQPDIQAAIKDPSEYRIIILGTPVWAGNMSAPMRSYIMQNRDRFDRVAAFCTMGGSGGDKVLNDMSALCGKPLVAKMALTESQVNGRDYGDRTAEFVGSIEGMQ